MTPRRLLSPRWLAAGGAVALAAVVGAALLLQNSGAACAAPPSTSAKSGKATFYDLGGGTGNCSFPSSPADDLFVALGPAEYSAGAACGTYLDVTGPKGKVRVKVTDSCPECAPGHLDLSRTAFKKIGNEVDGIIPITYKTVTGVTTPGPISVRVKEGSSPYWLAVLIDNHGNQLASVTVNGKTTHREDYNYWVIDGGAGSGPFKIKISDVYGHSVTVSGVKLSPGATQKTSARLVGGGVTSVVSTVTKAAKKKAATPSAAAPAPTASSAVPAPESTVADAPSSEVALPPAQQAVDLAAGAAHACG
ncbi:expansin EXLX1 family cellulose-binding protein [Actinoplanes subtropicus]|uniref:expansin EXLX1 family cellulose-binding protein n=1 Tax=Actinoplanes subtropicus TaxID=543632 RepID=UPI00068F2BE4|nr:expansin EXLX1 family cellulose-binding protein [Actinoplanes subtropicus]